MSAQEFAAFTDGQVRDLLQQIRQSREAILDRFIMLGHELRTRMANPRSHWNHLDPTAFRRVLRNLHSQCYRIAAATVRSPKRKPVRPLVIPKGRKAPIILPRAMDTHYGLNVDGEEREEVQTLPTLLAQSMEEFLDVFMNYTDRSMQSPPIDTQDKALFFVRRIILGHIGLVGERWAKNATHYEKKAFLIHHPAFFYRDKPNGNDLMRAADDYIANHPIMKSDIMDNLDRKWIEEASDFNQPMLSMRMKTEDPYYLPANVHMPLSVGSLMGDKRKSDLDELWNNLLYNLYLPADDEGRRTRLYQIVDSLGTRATILAAAVHDELPWLYHEPMAFSDDERRLLLNELNALVHPEGLQDRLERLHQQQDRGNALVYSFEQPPRTRGDHDVLRTPVRQLLQKLAAELLSLPKGARDLREYLEALNPGKKGLEEKTLAGFFAIYCQLPLLDLLWSDGEEEEGSVKEEDEKVLTEMLALILTVNSVSLLLNRLAGPATTVVLTARDAHEFAQEEAIVFQQIAIRALDDVLALLPDAVRQTLRNLELVLVQSNAYGSIDIHTQTGASLMSPLLDGAISLRLDAALLTTRLGIFERIFRNYLIQWRRASKPGALMQHIFNLFGRKEAPTMRLFETSIRMSIASTMGFTVLGAANYAILPLALGLPCRDWSQLRDWVLRAARTGGLSRPQLITLLKRANNLAGKSVTPTHGVPPLAASIQKFADRQSTFRDLLI